jgi:hypothetical protein
MSQFVITAAHLSYGTNGDVMDSAKFVQSLMSSPTTSNAGLVSTSGTPNAAPKEKRMVEFTA